MTIDFSILTIYTLSIIIFLATPGPVTLLVANTGLKHGVKASVKTILGTNFASLILIALSFFIIQGLLIINVNMLSWISILGGFYLIYLAIHMTRDNVLLDNDVPKVKNFLRDGFLLGISSPKDILFFIAFFPTFFTVSDDPMVAITVLTIVWVICDFSVLTLYSLVFSKLINDKVAGLVGKISGGILLLFAMYALYHGVSTLRT